MFRLVLLTLCCVAMVMSMEGTAREKRLVLHSDEDVAAAFQTMAAQMHSMNATIEFLKNDVLARDTTIQAIQTTTQLLHTTVESLQSTVDSRDTTIQTLQTKVDSRDSIIQSMQTTTQSLQSTVDSRDSTIQAMQTSVQSLQVKVDSRDSVIQSLQAKVDSRDTTIQSLQAKVDSRDSAIQAMQTTSQSLLNIIQSLQSTAVTRDTKIESLESLSQSRDATIQSLQTKLSTGQGSTYIRWGRTECEPNGTELVYKGFAGGSYYNHEGGAADYICLTQEPLWGNYTDSATYRAKVYGTEYEFPDSQSQALFGQRLYDHDVPCAVCRPQRATTVMIPGRNKCYPGWTEEYAGYLVSGHYGHNSASNYACLDIRPELVLGDSANDNGHLMYVAETVCGALKCPPYFDNRVITCVVCSR